MALTNSERQSNYIARLKARASMPLNLGEALDDGIPVERENLTPLEYMLRVMNDPNAAMDRRDKFAIAAAPYLHQKADEAAKTKKEQKAETAAEVSENGKFSAAQPPRLVA